jgi:hypothetical protein
VTTMLSEETEERGAEQVTLRTALPASWAEAVTRFGPLPCEPQEYERMTPAAQAIFFINLLRDQRDNERAFISQLSADIRARQEGLWDGAERRQADRRGSQISDNAADKIRANLEPAST